MSTPRRSDNLSSADAPSSERHGGRSRRPRRWLGIAALLIATGVIAGATDTPAVWGLPGGVLLGGMWITGRPRSRRTRTAVSAAIALTFAGAVLISPAVLFAWPAAALARLVQRRGLRAARIPLAVVGAVTALALAAHALGLPGGIVFLAIFPLVALSRRRGHMGCQAAA